MPRCYKGWDQGGCHAGRREGQALGWVALPTLTITLCAAGEYDQGKPQGVSSMPCVLHQPLELGQASCDRQELLPQGGVRVTRRRTAMSRAPVRYVAPPRATRAAPRALLHLSYPTPGLMLSPT